MVGNVLLSGLLLLNYFGELREKIFGIMGPGRGFRVILHAEDRILAVAEPGDRVVVEIGVGDFDLWREGVRIDGKAVILGGDGDDLAVVILDRLIRAPVSEFQLEGLSAESERDDLVAQANSKDGKASDELTDGFMRVGEGGGIARTVREEEAVRVAGKDVFCGGGGGQGFHLKSVLPQQAGDVFLHSEVQNRKPSACRGDGGELIAEGIGFADRGVS